MQLPSVHQIFPRFVAMVIVLEDSTQTGGILSSGRDFSKMEICLSGQASHLPSSRHVAVKTRCRESGESFLGILSFRIPFPGSAC
jgi:hypothetical protein